MNTVVGPDGSLVSSEKRPRKGRSDKGKPRGPQKKKDIAPPAQAPTGMSA